VETDKRTLGASARGRWISSVEMVGDVDRHSNTSMRSPPPPADLATFARQSREIGPGTVPMEAWTIQGFGGPFPLLRHPGVRTRADHIVRTPSEA
jgi:hypothetical protein